jgi:DNA-binding NtrC family response regulator
MWESIGARVERYARAPWPLLLVGPQGSGKTVLARRIHALSGRPGEGRLAFSEVTRRRTAAEVPDAEATPAVGPGGSFGSQKP